MSAVAKRWRLGILVGALVASTAHADAPPPAPSASSPSAGSRSLVVARVGPRTVTVAELEDRLAAMPPIQRASFGATPAEVRRKFLETIVIPEVLLALGAEKRHLEVTEPTAYRLQRARSNATLRVVRSQVGFARDIPMEDVRAYYEANRSRYDAPERIGIWRILCDKREEAQAVLEAAKKDGTPKTFTDLAREHSVDKATYLRGGNLGFLILDGVSNEPGLRVDPAIVRAAAAVKDGELVPEPVEESGYYAVVWRRGTLPPTRRTVEEAAAQIRDVLWKERVEVAQKKLIAELRARRLKAFAPELLDGLSLPLEEPPLPRSVR